MDSRVGSLATTPVGDSLRLKSALNDVAVARVTDVRYQPSGRDGEFGSFERARNISRRLFNSDQYFSFAPAIRNDFPSREL